jgi:hypothetical protein
VRALAVEDRVRELVHDDVVRGHVKTGWPGRLRVARE